MVKFVTSPRFALNWVDVNRFAHNALVFFGPVAIITLGAIAQQVPQEWAHGAIVLYALNLVTDLVRKWVNENTYKV